MKQRRTTRDTGLVGEEVATKFLMRKGYSIITRNYRRPWGEIDIIGVKGNTVRFVEVKAVSREITSTVTREKEGYRPEEQVHPTKLRKLSRTAEMYMNEGGDTRDYQIDVVAIFLDHTRRVARCWLYEQVL